MTFKIEPVKYRKKVIKNIDKYLEELKYIDGE